MADDKDDGGPAFPNTITEGPSGDTYIPTEYGVAGMSLRDWFAGQAFAGLCGAGGTWPRSDDGPEMARRAYAWADAMLAERSK